MYDSTYLVDLDTGIFADDSSSRTWSVEQDSVETTHDLWELSSIVVADDDILASHSVDVGGQTLCPSLVGVVCEDQTGVLQ